MAGHETKVILVFPIFTSGKGTKLLELSKLGLVSSLLYLPSLSLRLLWVSVSSTVMCNWLRGLNVHNCNLEQSLAYSRYSNEAIMIHTPAFVTN